MGLGISGEGLLEVMGGTSRSQQEFLVSSLGKNREASEGVAKSSKAEACGSLKAFLEACNQTVCKIPTPMSVTSTSIFTCILPVSVAIFPPFKKTPVKRIWAYPKNTLLT